MEVRLHGASPWLSKRIVLFIVAANVSYHGAGPWHRSSILQEALKRIGHSLVIPMKVRRIRTDNYMK